MKTTKSKRPRKAKPAPQPTAPVFKSFEEIHPPATAWQTLQRQNLPLWMQQTDWAGEWKRRGSKPIPAQAHDKAVLEWNHDIRYTIAKYVAAGALASDCVAALDWLGDVYGSLYKAPVMANRKVSFAIGEILFNLKRMFEVYLPVKVKEVEEAA